MLIPSPRYMLTHRLYINHQNVDTLDILLLEGGATQNDFRNGIRITQINILFLISCFQKPIVSIGPKNTLGLLV